MDDKEIDFSFIGEVGQKVNEYFLNDPNHIDWFNTVLDEYSTSDEFPPDIITIIIDKLASAKDEYCNKLIDDIHAIIKDENNIDNLSSSIFLPAFNEEEEENKDSSNEVKSIQSFSGGTQSYNEEEEDITDTSDPKLYFAHCIKKIMKLFYLSHDIAYVLCKKFKLNLDLIIQKWLSSQDEILQSLRIKIGSEMVPSLKSPLSLRKCGVGECPICCDETELFELYCGHTICQGCLIEDVRQMIAEKKTPCCRQAIEDGEPCGALLLFESAKEFLNEDIELIESFGKIVFNNEIVTNLKTKPCPFEFCDGVITPLNELPCHVGLCPKCGSAVCMRCHNDCHGPFSSCDKINFYFEKSKEMEKLAEAQKKWLESNRKKNAINQGSISQCYTKDIESMKQETKKKSIMNKKLMTKAINEIYQIGYKIDELRVHDEKGNELEMKQLQQKVIEKKQYHQSLQEETQKNEANLKIYLEDLLVEENYILTALSFPSRYNKTLYGFEKEMNKRAMQQIHFLNKQEIMEMEKKRLKEIIPFNRAGQNRKEEEEEIKEEGTLEFHLVNDKLNKASNKFIDTYYSRCPSCHTPIEKTEGCDHMVCAICGCNFNYRGRNEILPESSSTQELITSINHDPISSDKRVDFLRWSYTFDKFNKQKQIYDDLFAEVKSTKNKKMKSGAIGNADSYLCIRNKIAKILLKDTEKSEIKMKTYRIMNTALFAQSVIMWSYPSLYYIRDEPEKENLFEYKVNCLCETMKKFMKLIDDPAYASSGDFETFTDVLLKQIVDLLSMAETL